jgi:hypothetical protein
MNLFVKTTAAAAAIAAMVGLSACNNPNGTPVTSDSVADTMFAYACPIAVAIQASAVVLTAAQKVTLANAVADCNIYQTQGIAGFTTPAIVAEAVVTTIIAFQQNGKAFTALSPELQHRIIVGHNKLNLALKNAPAGFLAGQMLAH